VSQARKRNRANKAVGTTLSTATGPNDLWCADFKGEFKLGDYISMERPEVIETHGVWSRDSDIYSLAAFKADYRPAIYDGSLFWLRDDVLQRLIARGMSADLVSPRALPDTRYLGDEWDVENLMRFPAVTVLGR